MMADKAVEAMAVAMWQAESFRARGAQRLIPWDEELPQTQDTWRDTAQAALAAYHEHLAEQGLVIVPEVPTDGMVKAGFEDYPTIWTAAVTPEDRIGVYTAMIQAAKER